MSKPPKIERGKRAILAGRTGSGKSTLARWLLMQSPGSWLILNPKWTAAYDKLPGAVKVHGFDFGKIERHFDNRQRFIVVNPEQHQMNPETLDDFVNYFHSMYEGFGLCCDELYMMHNHGRPGPGLIGVLTRGRELKQSFLGLTQRPAWVSKFLFSEADYIGRMSLSLKQDRKTMVEYMGADADAESDLAPFDWDWYDVAADKLRHMQPVPD